MGFIHYNEKSWLVDKNDKPVYITGVNYVASYVCADFMSDFRPEVIEKDLAKIESMGLNAIRIPIYWEYAEPKEGVFNEEMFHRFNQFLDIARRHNIYVLPWMLVGVATEVVDIPLRKGRPIFEGDMLFAAENHLREFARRYKNEENILFWDIMDEPENYANQEIFPGSEPLPLNRKRFNHWMKHMYEAFHGEDKNHLVTLGFGDIATLSYGYKLLDAAEILDVMAVTSWALDSSVERLDSARNNYLLGFCVRMNAQRGKPVFTCEAPGQTNVWSSKDVIGRYYRTTLYSNLANGSTGVMPWCFNDYSKEIWNKGWLNDVPSEDYFGIVENDGTIKPAGRELSDFSRFVNEIGITDYQRMDAPVAIYVPSGYYDNILHTKRRLRAAYQFVRSCGADVDFVWEGGDLTRYQLVITVGSTMRNTEWEAIAQYAENGGNVIYDYSDMNGMSPYINLMCGMELVTRQQNYDYDNIIMKKDMGKLTAGQKLSFTMGPRMEPNDFSRGWPKKKAISICDEYLIVRPESAEVLAELPDGSPALLKNKYGKGTVWSFTGQFHSGMFEIKYDEYCNYMLFDMYGAIMSEIGVERPCVYVNSELEIGRFIKDNGEILLLLINHSPKENNVRVQLHRDLANRNMKVWEGREGVTFNNGELSLTMDAAEVVKLIFSEDT